MKDTNEEKINHKTLEIGDKIKLISELEHLRYHALRSSVVTQGTDKELFYLVLSKQAKELRRDYMSKHFPNIDETDWCLCKVASILRQVAYEVWEEDAEMLRRIDDIVDDIWSKATGEDLSGCAACREDGATSQES